MAAVQNFIAICLKLFLSISCQPGSMSQVMNWAWVWIPVILSGPYVGLV